MIAGKVAFIALLILQIVIRYPYRSQQTRAADRQEQFVLLLITIGMMILPFIYIFTDWLSFADYLASPPVVGSGVLVMFAGLWLFWRSHHDLGQNWSPTLEIHEEHSLVTRGIYQYIRHPMYAANWVMMLAQALLLSNWIAGLGGIISFSFMYFLRVQKEEDMMLREFGDQYQHYMSQTRRVIPKLGSKH